MDMKTLREVREEIWNQSLVSRSLPGADAARLRAAGFYPAELGSTWDGDWPAVHDWCREHVGEDHYTWTGGTFWFEKDRDAVSFSLKWS